MFSDPNQNETSNPDKQNNTNTQLARTPYATSQLCQIRSQRDTNATISELHLSQNIHRTAAYNQLVKSTSPHKSVTYDCGLEETCITQYNIKRGMRVFGKRRSSYQQIKTT